MGSRGVRRHQASPLSPPHGVSHVTSRHQTVSLFHLGGRALPLNCCLPEGSGDTVMYLGWVLFDYFSGLFLFVLLELKN